MGFAERPASHSANKTRNGRANYMRLKMILPVVEAGKSWPLQSPAFYALASCRRRKLAVFVKSPPIAP